MHKNPEKPNKHVRKNRRSGKLAFFPLNLLTKDFIISQVLSWWFLIGKDVGTLRVLIARKDHRLENQTPLLDDPILFHRMRLQLNLSYQM